MKEKKPFYKKFWFKALIVLIIIGAIIGPKEEDNKKEVAKSTTPDSTEVTPKENSNEDESVEDFQITDDMNDKEKIENILKSISGDQFENYDIAENDDETLGQISLKVYVPSDSVWSADSLINQQNSKIINILKTLKENNIEYTYYTHTVLSDFTDKYGNTDKGEIMHVYLPKSEIDKINFDNFDTENLKEIADEYYIHPSAK